MTEWWLSGGLGVLALFITSAMIYPLRKHCLLTFGLFPVVLCAILLSYIQWGGYIGWSGFLDRKRSNELAQQMLKQISGPQEIIDKMRAHLAKEPDSAKGWFLLGRLYANIQKTDEALDAFQKAWRLDPDDEQFTVHYAHALWTGHHQQFNSEIKELFNRLLKNNPNQPDALAMLAMDAYQAQHYEQAIDYWNRLLKLAPAQSEEARSIRKAIAKAQSQSH